MSTPNAFPSWREAAAQRGAKRARASTAGRRGSAAGAAAEDLVLTAARHYAAQGRLAIDKNHPRVVVVRVNKDASFTGRWAGKAPCDYSGNLASGRALHLEVKSTAETCLRLTVRDGPVLRPEQARWLAERAALGALVAVVVRVATGATRRKPGPAHRWFTLTWRGWLDATAAAAAEGAKSLSVALLTQHGRECPFDAGWPDWLAALEVTDGHG